MVLKTRKTLFLLPTWENARHVLSYSRPLIFCLLSHFLIFYEEDEVCPLSFSFICSKRFYRALLGADKLFQALVM